METRKGTKYTNGSEAKKVGCVPYNATTGSWWLCAAECSNTIAAHQRTDGISLLLLFCAARFYIVPFNQSLSRQPILMCVHSLHFTLCTAQWATNETNEKKTMMKRIQNSRSSLRSNTRIVWSLNYTIDPSISIKWRTSMHKRFNAGPGIGSILNVILSLCAMLKWIFVYVHRFLFFSPQSLVAVCCRLLFACAGNAPLFHRWSSFSIINAHGVMPHVSEWIFGQNHITRFTYTRSIRSSRATTAAAVAAAARWRQQQQQTAHSSAVNMLGKIWKRIRGPVTIFISSYTTMMWCSKTTKNASHTPCPVHNVFVFERLRVPTMQQRNK